MTSRQCVTFTRRTYRAARRRALSAFLREDGRRRRLDGTLIIASRWWETYLLATRIVARGRREKGMWQ